MRNEVKLKEITFSALEDAYSLRKKEPRYIGVSPDSYTKIEVLIQRQQRITVYTLPTAGIVFNRSVIVKNERIPDMTLVLVDLYEELLEDPFLTWAKEVYSRKEK